MRVQVQVKVHVHVHVQVLNVNKTIYFGNNVFENVKWPVDFIRISEHVN